MFIANFFVHFCNICTLPLELFTHFEYGEVCPVFHQVFCVSKLCAISGMIWIKNKKKLSFFLWLLNFNYKTKGYCYLIIKKKCVFKFCFQQLITFILKWIWKSEIIWINFLFELIYNWKLILLVLKIPAKAVSLDWSNFSSSICFSSTLLF